MATFVICAIGVVLAYVAFYKIYGRIMSPTSFSEPQWRPTIGQWSLPPDSRSHSIYCPHGTANCSQCQNQAVLAELHSGSCRECTEYRQKILEGEYRRLHPDSDEALRGLQELTANQELTASQITVGYLSPPLLMGESSILIPTPLRGSVIA